MSNSQIFSKRTKIIATIGPASNSLAKIKKLIQSGTDIFRVNASHIRSADDILNAVQLVRQASEEFKKSVGVFLDLQGPKIRIGELEKPEVRVKTGQDIIMTSKNILGNSSKVSVSYPHFEKDIHVGDPVFIDDGRIRMKVSSKTKEGVVCKVIQGGSFSRRKGVNLPITKLGMSSLTSKDLEDVETGVKAGVDFLALSFVSTADDVIELKKLLKKLNATEIQVISKIERQIAVDHIDEILEVSDAVMVARGDLGVEVGLENVPRFQKLIIRQANKLLKPVIVATQMLESMINAPIATRAEVSDVANAVYDRCDAVMLSGETAVGIDPISVVKTMRSICQASDEHMVLLKQEDALSVSVSQPNRALSICQAADAIAEANHAKAIMAFTSSGNTPLLASKLNPTFPVLAPTDSENVFKRCSLYRGVIPMIMPVKFKDIHRWTAMINIAVEEAKRLGYLKVGDVIVVTAGIPIGVSNGINSIRLVTVT